MSNILSRRLKEEFVAFSEYTKLPGVEEDNFLEKHFFEILAVMNPNTPFKTEV
jgi:hypothetical protein